VVDPVELTRDLIRIKSVTPCDGNALLFIEKELKRLGFTTHIVTFEEEGTPDVPNLYARLGDASPNFCFAGHTDVVPSGEHADWSHAPYDAVIDGGQLYGRGAADMKGAIAAFVCALERFVTSDKTLKGSLSLLLTGDEEGPAINGTQKMLDWMREQNETIDACLVGEPTNPSVLGESFKIGRRGSLHGVIRALGVQGHVAYPHLADNPIPHLVRLIDALREPFDQGNAHFQPSNLEFLDLQVGNDRDNQIPQEARARFNIRFNSEHDPQSLQQKIRERLDQTGAKYEIDFRVSGDSFLTQEGPLSFAVVKAVERVVGKAPEASTAGGTSDARFIKNMCPVVEFGLVGATMHKLDERVAIKDIETLTQIYHHMIDDLVS